MNDTRSSNGSADPADTPKRLMAAGRRLFAKQGFEGTSIRALTQEAGANIGAVTYHFGTKEAFYLAVLGQVHEPLREGLRLLAKAPLPATKRLEMFVQRMFQYLRENADLPRFFVQEVVIGEVPSEPTLETVRTMVGTLAGIFREGQEEGSIVPGDPVLMALTLLSQPIYLSLMPRFLTRIDLRDAQLPQPRGSAEDHVLAVLRRAFVVSEEESE